MKKIRNILIIVCIITVILVLIIVKIKSKEKYLETADEYKTYENGLSEGEKEVLFIDYMTVKNCLQNYINMLNTDSYLYYQNNGSEYLDNTEELQKKQNIYDLLSEKYIQKNKITVDNVYNFVEKINVHKMVVPCEIEKIINTDENLNVESFYVSAIIFEISNKEKYEYVYAIINVDIDKNTFSVEPLKSEVKPEDLTSYNLGNTIEQNNNNTYISLPITNQNIVSEYFLNYKYILLSDIQFAYSRIDEEYKEKRFNTIESFKEYIIKNKERFEKIRVEQYEINKYENYTEYVCMDQFGNTYIFNEKETLDYDVILDLYTIDIPQFIEKYDSANIQTKVLLNIEKIKQALNSADYSYVYSKLADSFKNNKYKTEQEFVEYMENAIYNNFDMEYKEFSNEGETYIYNVEIRNLDNEADEIINMQIIMQLKEERDFVMSFNIKE